MGKRSQNLAADICSVQMVTNRLSCVLSHVQLVMWVSMLLVRLVKRVRPMLLSP